MPGCGKTYFAKRLVEELRRAYPFAGMYVLDSKGGGDFDGWPGIIDTDDPPEPLPIGGPSRVQVWAPDDDDPHAYDDWLRGILKARRPALVLIDELSSLAEGPDDRPRYPKNLTRILKQGRKLGIAPVVLTQDAAGIPRGVRNLTHHFVYFRLGRTDELGIRRACKLLGFDPPVKGQSPPEPTHRYGFWHRPLQPAPGATVEYDDSDDFFGVAA